MLVPQRGALKRFSSCFGNNNKTDEWVKAWVHPCDNCLSPASHQPRSCPDWCSRSRCWCGSQTVPRSLSRCHHPLLPPVPRHCGGAACSNTRQTASGAVHTGHIVYTSAKHWDCISVRERERERERENFLLIFTTSNTRCAVVALDSNLIRPFWLFELWKFELGSNFLAIRVQRKQKKNETLKKQS